MPYTPQQLEFLKVNLGVVFSPGYVTAPPQSDNAPKAGGNGLSLKNLASCRLAWVKVCAKMREEVAALQREIIATYSGDESFDSAAVEEVITKVEEINGMVSAIDESLADELDEVINAKPGTDRAAAQKKAISLADQYMAYVDSNADFALVDTNEFYSTNLKKVAKGALSDIQKELAVGT